MPTLKVDMGMRWEEPNTDFISTAEIVSKSLCDDAGIEVHTNMIIDAVNKTHTVRRQLYSPDSYSVSPKLSEDKLVT